MPEDKVVIHAMMGGEEGWLEHFRKKGIDVSKCHVCDTSIVRTEIEPRYLTEKIRRFFGSKKKYYDWNIGGFDNQGVFCESFSCLLHRRDEEIYGKEVKKDWLDNLEASKLPT